MTITVVDGLTATEGGGSSGPISGTTINNSPIGNTTPSTGNFTVLSAATLAITGTATITTSLTMGSSSLLQTGRVNVTNSTTVANGMYLPSPNVLGFTANSTQVITASAGEVKILPTAFFAAGQRVAVTAHTVSGNVSLTTANFALIVNKAFTEATTVQIPANPPDGYIFYVKDGRGNASTSNITVTVAGSANSIDGAGNSVINSDLAGRQFLFVASAYYVV